MADQNSILAEENVKLRLALESALKWLYSTGTATDDTLDHVKDPSMIKGKGFSADYAADIYRMNAGYKILHPEIPGHGR